MGWTGNRGRREMTPTFLPVPEGRLEVERVTVRTLVGAGFRAEPGECVALAGQGGDGSTLCRVLAGRLRPEAGVVRLGGVPLDRYPPRQLAWLVGFLPAEVGLLPGTVTDDIARMSALPEPELVAEAAELAGAHEAILRLPDGYANPARRGRRPARRGPATADRARPGALRQPPPGRARRARRRPGRRRRGGARRLPRPAQGRPRHGRDRTPAPALAPARRPDPRFGGEAAPARAA